MKVKIGIIGGTGLDNNGDLIEKRNEKSVSTPYGSVEIIEGKIKGVDCVLLARHGKSHSVMPTNVNYRANISALKILECTHIIATTATGSLKEEISPGSIVIVDDFIDRTKSRIYTFYDGSQHALGVCHIPMSPAFDERTRNVIIETAKELGIQVFPKGTVVCIEGPRFSTKAESNIYRSWGSDLVGMTICPEVQLAKEKGLLYASIAMATDYDCWRECSEGRVSVEEVMATFKNNVEKVTKLLIALIPNIAKLDWTETINDLNNLVNSSIMLPHQYSK
ncbi:hypothetical protein PVAND_010331 [Polypedilum vanderplanki]|uniref:S-methyl-5'-thioadenosine phosphorylase n=1 Tax=Polypedilum vanderplanki TaxID=319348 RepID=A0A9J6CFD1_POLVA|nr:hypothetical protein PVAND_010331 [Polypedilum vanderplanki]